MLLCRVYRVNYYLLNKYNLFIFLSKKIIYLDIQYVFFEGLHTNQLLNVKFNINKVLPCM